MKDGRYSKQPPASTVTASHDTGADGRFGPDLTHLMSRTTIAGGSVANTPANLRRWIENPDALKPGVLMPSMNLNPRQLDAVTAYLLTLE